MSDRTPLDSLPHGWSWSALEHITATEPNAMTDGPFGSKLKTEHYTESGVRVIRLGNLGAGRFINDDCAYVSPEHYESLRKHEVRPGDLLIAALAEPVGRCCRVPPDLGTAIVKADCIRLKPHPSLSPDFIMNWLNSPPGRRQAEEACHGIGRLRMNMSDMRALLVPVAPGAEQRRIVAKIEALTARSRAAREALEQVPPLLERFRQSVLAAAFRGDLTAEWRRQHPDVEPASVLLERVRTERRRRWEEAELAAMRAKGKTPANDKWKARYDEPTPADLDGLPSLPPGWCWASLSELAWDAGYGTSAKCDYEGEGPPVLRIPNVAGGRLLLDDMKFALDPDACSGDALEALDFLIVRTNGSHDLIGRGALVEQPLLKPHYFASYLIRFRLACTPHIAKWIAVLWESPAVRRRLELEAATSAGQYNVNLAKLSRLPLPLPPAEELAPMLAAIERATSAREPALARARSALGELERLDQSILAKAFRGELVPQDPNDEPASLLLERIRVQRTTPDRGISSGTPRASTSSATSRQRRRAEARP